MRAARKKLPTGKVYIHPDQMPLFEQYSAPPSITSPLGIKQNKAATAERSARIYAEWFYGVNEHGLTRRIPDQNLLPLDGEITSTVHFEGSKAYQRHIKNVQKKYEKIYQDWLAGTEESGFLPPARPRRTSVKKKSFPPRRPVQFSLFSAMKI